MRGSARALKAFDILQKCDNLRDNVLPELGVRLEDRELSDPAVFKVCVFLLLIILFPGSAIFSTRYNIYFRILLT